MSFPIGLKRSAAMVVLRNEREFLLLRRSNPPHVGKYLPVGGKLDPFEDPYVAAIRETREETGLHLENLRYAGVLIETSDVDYNWQCNGYVADIDRIAPPPCPEGQLEWIPFERVPSVPTPPTDWYIYQYLMRGQVFAFNAIYDKHLEMTRMVEEIEPVQVFPPL